MSDGHDHDDGTDRDPPGSQPPAPDERPAFVRWPYPPDNDAQLGYPPPQYYAGPPDYYAGPPDYYAGPPDYPSGAAYAGPPTYPSGATYAGYPPAEPYGAPPYLNPPGGYPPGYPGPSGYPPGYPGYPPPSDAAGYPGPGYPQPRVLPARRRRVGLWSALGALALVAIAVVVLFGSPGVLVTTKLSHTAVESYIEQQLGAVGVVCNDGHDITIVQGASVDCSAQDGGRYRVTITRAAGAHYTVVREGP